MGYPRQQPEIKYNLYFFALCIHNSFSPFSQLQVQNPRTESKKQIERCVFHVTDRRSKENWRVARQTLLLFSQPPKTNERAEHARKQATTRREPIRVNAIPRPRPRSRSSTIHTKKKEKANTSSTPSAIRILGTDRDRNDHFQTGHIRPRLRFCFQCRRNHRSVAHATSSNYHGSCYAVFALDSFVSACPRNPSHLAHLGNHRSATFQGD